ncbi:MAG: Lrp/AsnC family transcriptional regulator [Deltaproteobacteria bacterium]|nr:Lrp/AsnC family transcriptional regulator [Deltaproteobacteria bacterium]
MDDIDRAIINEIQSDFPIESRPYRELGKRLNLPEREVFRRLKALKDEGIIRRIGGNFSSKKLNYASTLCAAQVPKEKIEEFVREVNKYPGVTHNYLRISRSTGVTEILNLPAVRTFKIKVDFEV